MPGRIKKMANITENTVDVSVDIHARYRNIHVPSRTSLENAYVYPTGIRYGADAIIALLVDFADNCYRDEKSEPNFTLNIEAEPFTRVDGTVVELDAIQLIGNWSGDHYINVWADPVTKKLSLDVPDSFEWVTE